MATALPDNCNQPLLKLLQYLANNLNDANLKNTATIVEYFRNNALCQPSQPIAKPTISTLAQPLPRHNVDVSQIAPDREEFEHYGDADENDYADATPTESVPTRQYDAMPEVDLSELKTTNDLVKFLTQNFRFETPERNNIPEIQELWERWHRDIPTSNGKKRSTVSMVKKFSSVLKSAILDSISDEKKKELVRKSFWHTEENQRLNDEIDAKTNENNRKKVFEFDFNNIRDILLSQISDPYILAAYLCFCSGSRLNEVLYSSTYTKADKPGYINVSGVLKKGNRPAQTWTVPLLHIEYEEFKNKLYQLRHFILTRKVGLAYADIPTTLQSFSSTGNARIQKLFGAFNYHVFRKMYAGYIRQNYRLFGEIYTEVLSNSLRHAGNESLRNYEIANMIPFDISTVALDDYKPAPLFIDKVIPFDRTVSGAINARSQDSKTAMYRKLLDFTGTLNQSKTTGLKTLTTDAKLIKEIISDDRREGFATLYNTMLNPANKDKTLIIDTQKNDVSDDEADAEA